MPTAGSESGLVSPALSPGETVRGNPEPARSLSGMTG
jgi:hypothetical protein